MTENTNKEGNTRYKRKSKDRNTEEKLIYNAGN